MIGMNKLPRERRAAIRLLQDAARQWWPVALVLAFAFFLWPDIARRSFPTAAEIAKAVRDLPQTPQTGAGCGSGKSATGG